MKARTRGKSVRRRLSRLRSVCTALPLIAAVTAALGVISLAISFVDRSGRRCWQLAQLWARLVLRIAGVRVQVEGSERIAPGSTYVFAANHRSYLDLPCILAHFPPRVRFLVDKRLFSLPLVGGYLRRGGHLPITNASAREALTSMSDAAETAKASGMSFFVFPEGTRSRGPLFRFKDGAAYIAIRAGIPIVPVALSGTGALLPVGSLVIRSGLARLEIGSPVPTLDLSLQDRTVLSRTLRRTIEQHRWQLAGAHRS